MALSASLVTELSRLAHLVAELDLSRPEEAVRALDEALPTGRRRDFETMLIEAHGEGTLTPRQGTPEGVWFGRVAKPSVETSEMSIDAVDMEGEATPHTHPRGEVSFCVAREGAPLFDGHSPGWVVLPPGSHHTPTVVGGRMLIVYFLPGGAVEWGPKA
ncbi:DUF4863 family protein [Vulgatibacter incomptus]|uniref:p-hydroxylaminobenzoate lyase n=1 Tax=Vulgatibacter incomptus TaxID=1391653 RepID=A0A0K1PHN5_9BACT|nr:DUF4863 family protein [Vulgatibacter incomptus]AKU92911.1 P-hydroxylaminobenzoate lyase [Vulgatibacter incomptus]